MGPHVPSSASQDECGRAISAAAAQALQQPGFAAEVLKRMAHLHPAAKNDENSSKRSPLPRIAAAWRATAQSRVQSWHRYSSSWIWRWRQLSHSNRALVEPSGGRRCDMQCASAGLGEGWQTGPAAEWWEAP